MKMSQILSVRVAPALLLAFLLSLGLSSCREDEKQLVCFRLPVTDEWGTQLVQEMSYEVAKYPDLQLEVSYVLPGEGDGEYLEFIEQSIERDAKAIIIYPYLNVYKNCVRRAMNKGISVVILRDEKEMPERYSSCIAREERRLAQLMAQDVVKQMGGRGTLLELYGGKDGVRDLRSVAFHEVIDTIPGIHVVGSLYGEYKLVRAHSEVERFLNTHQEPVDMVVAMNDRMALGARKAIEQNPHSAQWKPFYVGVDMLNNDSIGIGRVEDGSIDISYYNPTGGKEAIQAVANLLHGEPCEVEYMLKPMRVTRASAPVLRAQYEKVRKQYETQCRQHLNTERDREGYQRMQSYVHVLLFMLLLSVVLLLRQHFQGRRLAREVGLRDDQLLSLSQDLQVCRTQQAVLESKCEQLEAERDRWHGAIRSDGNGEEVALVEDSRDFHTLVLDLIKEQMGKEEFSVDHMAECLCLSRSQLFRRCRAEFDMSPNDLLRTMRMECAERLLRTTRMNISEVAYRVGYTNNKYFSKMFREHFGKPPSEVRKDEHSE